MGINRLAIAALLLTLTSCSKFSVGTIGVTDVNVPSAPNSPKLVNCPVELDVSEFFIAGSTRRDVWEKAFRNMNSDYVAGVFLDDWKKGDSYEVLGGGCSETHKPRVILYIDFTTPRLGEARLSAEMVDSELIAYGIFLSSIGVVE